MLLGKDGREWEVSLRIILICWLAIAASASGQTTECAKVTRSGDEVTMIADSIRVVDSIANTLAQRFGVLVNAEEPQYQFSEDLQDMRDADPDWSAQHPKVHYLVPKRRHMEIHFSVLPDGSPSDVNDLMRQVLEKANQQTPFRYRLDADGEFFSFVPTATRDANGVVVAAMPLLDRRVTIPLGQPQGFRKRKAHGRFTFCTDRAASVVAKLWLLAFLGAFLQCHLKPTIKPHETCWNDFYGLNRHRHGTTGCYAATQGGVL